MVLLKRFDSNGLTNKTHCNSAISKETRRKRLRVHGTHESSMELSLFSIAMEKLKLRIEFHTSALSLDQIDRVTRFESLKIISSNKLLLITNDNHY